MKFKDLSPEAYINNEIFFINEYVAKIESVRIYKEKDGVLFGINIKGKECRTTKWHINDTEVVFTFQDAKDRMIEIREKKIDKCLSNIISYRKAIEKLNLMDSFLETIV
jgi:hypothetical protein